MVLHVKMHSCLAPIYKVKKAYHGELYNFCMPHFCILCSISVVILCGKMIRGQLDAVIMDDLDLDSSQTYLRV